jgi:hypothetical protein
MQIQGHPNRNKKWAQVPFSRSPIGMAVDAEAAGTSLSCLPSHAEWEENTGSWIDNEAFRGWRRNILESKSATSTRAIGHSAPHWGSASATGAPYWGSAGAGSNANSRHPARGERLHLGVIRGGPELYPSLRGTIAPATTSSCTLNINCLIDTGWWFSNFCKETIARQLVDVALIAANASRLVTLADGSSVSTVGSIVCNLRLTCNTVAVSLEGITMHILPELAFDVILGFPTIRK